MSYTRRSSSTGESVRAVTRESGWYVLQGLVFYTIAFFVLFLGFEGWAIFVYVFYFKYLIERWFTEYGLTDRRVVFRRGIVRRLVREMDISSIEGVDLYQNFWQRLFGIGTITVRGRGNHVVDWPCIGGAVGVKRALQEVIDARR
jgi:uncharacterized membrane protein YdbT with pleckstrin-like domain